MKLETFFEKFDQFADAPDAVAKMRELVLQLAVQGRLVSQSPSDEPADALAVTIAENRAAFVKKRSLDRQRVFASVEDDQCPFALPSGWVWTRLGNLCRVQAGFAFESAAFVQGDSGVPMIRIRDITKDHTQVNYVGEYREEFLVDAGDYLVGMDGNFTVAKWRGPRALLNQRVSRLQWYSQHLEPSFLAIAAQYRLSELQGTKAYTTVDHLSSGQIENAVVPLPPLAEQKRIVAKVDELMALCDRLEAQQQERETRHAALARASLARFADAPTPGNLNSIFHPSFSVPPADLRKSILTLAVQGKLVPQDPNDEPAEELIARLTRELTPEQRRSQAAPLPPLPAESLQYEVPDSWTWARFREVAIIASNLVKPDEFLDFTHLAPDNIEKGNGVLLPCRTVREDKVISSNHRFYPGQIVYSKIRPNLAKVVVVDFEGLCSADMYPIDALVDAFYLQRYMLSESFLVQAVKTDTRVAMPKINQMELNAIAVPIPPLAEQRRIVAKVDQLIALVDALETQLAASRATAANLLSALVAELTGTSNNGKVSVPSASTTGRRGRPRKSP
jgi:type I restriction enzyme S subunit